MEEQKNQKETDSKSKNSLFKEENEPDFIKNLFNKKISKELEEKLLKDEGKYNKIEKNKEEEDENINEINTDSKKLKKKLQNIEEKNEEDEENLFPIKSKKQENNAEESLKSYELNKNLSLESQLKGTKTLNDLINEDDELKKQFNQLNNICDYTMKSLNYIVNKEAGFADKEKLDSKIIENTNMKLNEFLIGPIYEMAKENNFDIDKINKQIEESERKNYETTHYDNFMKTIPEDQEREMKLKKFQEHFFSKAKQMSTNELLDKITEIINNTKNEEIQKHQKEKNDNLNNENNIYFEYEGDWKNDLREGQGLFHWPNGQEFRGGYINDLKEGPGSMFWASNGQRLEAVFSKGEIVGTATRYYSNGDIYELVYENGKKVSEKKKSGGSKQPQIQQKGKGKGKK